MGTTQYPSVSTFDLELITRMNTEACPAFEESVTRMNRDTEVPFELTSTTMGPFTTSLYSDDILAGVESFASMQDFSQRIMRAHKLRGFQFEGVGFTFAARCGRRNPPAENLKVKCQRDLIRSQNEQ